MYNMGAAFWCNEDVCSWDVTSNVVFSSLRR